ncbi:MAG: LuxR C-terminal-related transcriptional regulator [Rhodocyclaceae bacterium]|nr:LuxR C-terminal-related transcriptional regulator [Rhodocyclaceae bacterium]
MNLLNNGSAYSELVLKTTPPRAPRNLLVRPRLGLSDEQLRDRPVIVVQAPPGFGKTSLLAQWRHEYLAQGAAVAWISAEAYDDPQRFLHALVLSVRVGCGRPNFGRFLLEGIGSSMGTLEGITAWLAEVTQAALDLVLIMDEADQLSEAGKAALAYLLHNAPANLRLVVAGRGGLDAVVSDLCLYGQCVSVGVEMLRFRLDETLALVSNRLGVRVDADTCARLFEMTEGWPLGTQLALAAMEGRGDPRAAMEAIAAGAGDQKERLVGALMSRLDPADTDFLARISAVDMLHPDLCRALTGLEQAPEILSRLARDTPIFVVADDSQWCRLHALARETLRARLAAMPSEEQEDLHVRALYWLAEHGMTEEAARHAHAAGRHEAAYDLAEQCLYDAVVQGHLSTVRDWLELLPEAELDRRPRILLAAAWALAVSERHEDARRLVARLLAHPEVDEAQRFECALILSGAAYYADEPDECVEVFRPWMSAPPAKEPRLLQTHANRLSVLAILQGDAAQARRYQQMVPRGDFGKAYGYAARWGDYCMGLSYLWEGQVLLAEQVLRPAMAQADADLGRRHPLGAMFAALLAAATYERDKVDEAAALLANRLDILERSGTPDTVLIGYRTAARVAAAQGVEHRALDLLQALFAIGVARRLPRLCTASLSDQIRIHAGRFRSETCRELAKEVDGIVAAVSAGGNTAPGSLKHRALALFQAMSHANAALAAQDWKGALAALAEVVPLADQVRMGRQKIEIMALRAFCLDRNRQDGRPLMREAMSLAQTYGLVRTFVDAHPALVDWARRVAEEDAGGEEAEGAALSARAFRPQAAKPSAPRAVPSMVLTPKEREVLELLARKFSNKEIAQAMAVGEATVKWHLRNLFDKLSAGTRRHVVRRAQVLGLLEGGD